MKVETRGGYRGRVPANHPWRKAILDSAPRKGFKKAKKPKVKP